jgi:hypothetical protein
MKKTLAAMVLFVLVAALSATTVFAEDLAGSSAASTTEGSEAETDLPESPTQEDSERAESHSSAAVAGSTADSEILPIEVTQSTDGMEIRKVYELSPDTDPERLPREGFERNGIIYSCADIMREVLIGDEFKTMTVSERAESKKDDTEAVLEVLPEFKEVEEEDGFAGKLYLDMESIESEASGYGNASTPYTVSKSYPNLPSNDPYHVPKTLDDNGQVLQLQGIEWQGDIYAQSSEGGNYTAVASYGGTKVSQYVESYTISADYTGEVSRKGVGVIRYTIIFTGAAAPAPTQVPEELPTTDPAPSGGSGGWIIMLIILLLAGGGAAVYFLNKRKTGSGYAADQDYSQAEYYPAGDDETPDDGNDDQEA